MAKRLIATVALWVESFADGRPRKPGKNAARFNQGGIAMPRPKKPRGRPPKYQMPEPLDVDMDTLAEVVLKAKLKEVWRYEQETGRSPSKRQAQ